MGIKDSADMFRTKVWPVTNDFVRNIKDFLNEYYGPRVDFEDWKDDLGDCLEAAKAYRCISVSLVQMYRRLAREFAKENEPLTTLAAALNVEVELLNRKMEKVDVSIEENTRMSGEWGKVAVAWPHSRSCLPVGRKRIKGVEVRREQWKSIQQQRGLSLGVESVRSRLVPALENFGHSMQVLAGFFDAMRRDLIAISKTSDVAKKRHFIRYQETAVAISGRVDAFNMIESAVSVTLSSLPEPRTREVMERAADVWLQSIIDEQETEETVRPLLQAFKATFSRGTKVARAVASFADVRGPSDDDEGPAERAAERARMSE